MLGTRAHRMREALLSFVVYERHLAQAKCQQKFGGKEKARYPGQSLIHDLS